MKLHLPHPPHVPQHRNAPQENEDLNADLPSTRRAVLHALAGLALSCAIPTAARAHGVVGLIRPAIAVPDMEVVRHDGKKSSLSALLLGKATAMQFMFTGCSESCPLQGALFAATQEKLKTTKEQSIQLLSLSIDPLGDDAKTIAAWLRRFKAGPNWIGAVPTMDGLESLRKALGETRESLGNHTAQVLLFDRQGQLVWRTENLPPVDVIARQLERIASA